MWRLFLDDERDPPRLRQDQAPFVVCRSMEGAIEEIGRRGPPAYVSFDNDLGTDREGRHLAQWLVEKDLNAGGRWLPEDFDFYVHSQNVAAAAAIRNLLDQYLRHRRTETSPEP